jgi:hypothetical protein
MDVSNPENLGVQLLTQTDWIGRKKARAAARWAEARGFKTVISERPFTAATRRSEEEPGLVFVGVDNLPARRAVARAEAGFHLVIDAGLGATSEEIFDIRLHAFPGFRSPEIAWPEIQNNTEPELSSALKLLVEQGRIDHCGAIIIAGKSLGVPSTAVSAAAIQIAQAYRAITTATATYCDLFDVSLINPERATGHETNLPRAGVIPFQKVLGSSR